MLTGTKYHSIYSILVYAQKSGGRPHANALCGVMNNLFYFFI
jgi:hypothetical protein